MTDHRAEAERMVSDAYDYAARARVPSEGAEADSTAMWAIPHALLAIHDEVRALREALKSPETARPATQEPREGQNAPEGGREADGSHKGCAHDQRVRAWQALVAHPFWDKCRSTDGPLLDAMIERLDRLTTTPMADAPAGPTLHTLEDVAKEFGVDLDGHSDECNRDGCEETHEPETDPDEAWAREKWAESANIAPWSALHPETQRVLVDFARFARKRIKAEMGKCYAKGDATAHDRAEKAEAERDEAQMERSDALRERDAARAEMDALRGEREHYRELWLAVQDELDELDALRGRIEADRLASDICHSLDFTPDSLLGRAVGAAVSDVVAGWTTTDQEGNR